MLKNFIDAIGNTSTAPTITAIFKDGTTAEYTTAILNELKSDADVVCIYESDSGVCIYIKEEATA